MAIASKIKPVIIGTISQSKKMRAAGFRINTHVLNIFEENAKEGDKAKVSINLDSEQAKEINKYLNS